MDAISLYALAEIKGAGIILDRRWMREADLLVHILTKDYGQLRMYAFGALNSRRRFSQGCDLFWHVTFHGTKSKNGWWTLEEITVLNMFSGLARNPQKFRLAADGVRLIQRLAPLESANHNLYVLLGSFLQTVTAVDDVAALRYVFNIRALQYSGLFSLPKFCVRCDKNVRSASVMVRPDGLLCLDCLSEHRECVLMTAMEQYLVDGYFRNHRLREVYHPTFECWDALCKLQPLVERLNADYGLLEEIKGI